LQNEALNAKIKKRLERNFPEASCLLDTEG